MGHCGGIPIWLRCQSDVPTSGSTSRGCRRGVVLIRSEQGYMMLRMFMVGREDFENELFLFLAGKSVSWQGFQYLPEH